MNRKKRSKVRRRTIMIDADNQYKLKILQANLIEKTNSTVSFSYVIGAILKRHYHIG